MTRPRTNEGRTFLRRYLEVLKRFPSLEGMVTVGDIRAIEDEAAFDAVRREEAARFEQDFIWQEALRDPAFVAALEQGQADVAAERLVRWTVGAQTRDPIVLGFDATVGDDYGYGPVTARAYVDGFEKGKAEVERQLQDQDSVASQIVRTLRRLRAIGKSKKDGHQPR